MAAVGYVFMCMVFGTTYVAIKIGLNQGIPPLYMAAIRFSFASLLILVYLAARKVEFPKTRREYGEIAVLGILMTSIPFAALFWSQQYINSGMASLLVATAPAFIAILSKADRVQWMGVGMAVVGVYFIASPELQGDRFTWKALIACCSIVVSEFFFAYGAIRSKELLSRGISPQMFNGLQMAFASLFLFTGAFLFENPASVNWNQELTLSLLYLAIIASVFASGVYYWLVKVTNPLFPSTWTYVAPILALVVGHIFLDENVTLSGAVGALFIIGGVLLVNRKVVVSVWHSIRQSADHRISASGTTHK